MPAPIMNSRAKPLARRAILALSDLFGGLERLEFDAVLLCHTGWNQRGFVRDEVSRTGFESLFNRLLALVRERIWSRSLKKIPGLS